MELTKPEVRVYLDRDKAADLGVDVRDIASAVNTLIGGREVSQFRTGGKSYDVRVRLIPEQRTTFSDINRLLVRNHNGELILGGSMTCTSRVSAHDMCATWSLFLVSKC